MIDIIDNSYISDIMHHFLNKYIFFDTNIQFNDSNIQNARTISIAYFEELKLRIKENNIENLVPFSHDYYESIYSIEGILIFYNPPDNMAFFKEKELYSKLLNGLFFTIVSEDLKPGDSLPTSLQLCKQYSVSEKTVRKAYGILLDMGLISRKERVGTKLIANINDDNIKSWLSKMFAENKKSLFGAIDALYIITVDFCEKMLHTIPCEAIIIMEQKLIENKRHCDLYKVPFMFSEIILDYFAASLPNGILQKYYYYAHAPVSEFIALGSTLNGLFDYSSVSAFEFAHRAIIELKAGNNYLFYSYAEKAMAINAAFLKNSFEKQLDKFKKDLC